MQNSITFVLFYLISCLLLYCDQTFQLQLVRRIEAVVVSCIETVPVCRTILLLFEVEKVWLLQTWQPMELCRPTKKPAKTKTRAGPTSHNQSFQPSSELGKNVEQPNLKGFILDRIRRKF